MKQSRDTKTTGDVSQIVIMAALIRAGAIVLTPYGDNRRYDMAIERDGKILRVQCKTAWKTKGRYSGCIAFACCSSYRHRGRGTKNYRGSADLFAVFSPDLNKIFIIPVAIAPKTSMSLRYEATVTGQARPVWESSDFEFVGDLDSLWQPIDVVRRTPFAKKAPIRKKRVFARGTHGTAAAYRHCGPPKCDLCREARRAAFYPGSKKRVLAQGTHGTPASYAHCGPPRCELCKRAMSQYLKQRRQKEL